MSRKIGIARPLSKNAAKVRSITKGRTQKRSTRIHKRRKGLKSVLKTPVRGGEGVCCNHMSSVGFSTILIYLTNMKLKYTRYRKHKISTDVKRFIF
jgi:hypothetical protein